MNLTRKPLVKNIYLNVEVVSDDINGTLRKDIITYRSCDITSYFLPLLFTQTLTGA